MALFLTTLVSFPTVIYSVLLGVVVFYWLFVVVGGVSHNLLGDGLADGAADGLAGHGSIEGAAKGGLEGAADSFHVDTSGGADGHAHGMEAHETAGEGSGIGAVLAALRLRSAPATVVLSLIITFSWLFCTLAMEAVTSRIPALALPAGIGVLILAPILSLIPTSILVRPLGRFFITHEAPTRRQLVGRTCRIRTGRVTDNFGEAIIEGEGAEIVIRVRVDAAEALGRGEEALIVDFDEERDAFLVAPLRNVMAPPP